MIDKITAFIHADEAVAQDDVTPPGSSLHNRETKVGNAYTWVYHILPILALSGARPFEEAGLGEREDELKTGNEE